MGSILEMICKRRFYQKVVRAKAFSLLIASWAGLCHAQGVTSQEFLEEAKSSVPVEERYDYHERLKNGPVHQLRRSSSVKPEAAEMEIANSGWKLWIGASAGVVLSQAGEDFQDVSRN